jgi:putative ABC transport system permease protein
MNSLKLTLSYLKFKKLNTLLIIILLALGYASISLLINFSQSFNQKLQNDSKAIDIVVGAKGSPLQLILSTIYHADIPNGNISYEDATKISKLKDVKNSLFIGLGDNYNNSRIVGTEAKFLEFYNIKILSGSNIKNTFDAVIGSNVAKNNKLKIGDEFFGAHGVSGYSANDKSGDEHKEFAYKVVGILEESGSITDNLIFTPIESVWKIHSNHQHNQHDENVAEHNKAHDHEHEIEQSHDVTAVLLQLKTPVAIYNLPRIINAKTNLLAANPAFEATRLFDLLSFNTKLLKAFSYIIVASAIFMILISLYSNLKDRAFDYAVIRAMGGSKLFIAKNTMLECLIITVLGLAIGLLFVILAIGFLPNISAQFNGLNLHANLFSNEQIILLGSILGLAILASLIPAITAYKVDIAKNLQK